MGTIHIPSNDADESVFDINVRGIVTKLSPPDIELAIGNQVVVGASGNIDFGAVSANGSIIKQMITITNRGQQTLTLFIPSTYESFRIAGVANNLILASGASQTFSLIVDNTAVSLRESVIAFITNDPDESSPFIRLRARVLEPITLAGGHASNPDISGIFYVYRGPLITQLNPANGRVPFDTAFVLE